MFVYQRVLPYLFAGLSIHVRMCSRLSAGLFLTHGAQVSWDYCLVIARCCKYHLFSNSHFLKLISNWLSYLHWGLHILNPIRFCWFLPWYPWKSRVSICLLCNVLSIQAVLNTKQFSSLATCSFGSSYNTPKEKRRLKAIRDGKEVGLGMAKLTFGRCFFYR